MGRLSPDLEELRVKGLRALARCMPTDEGSAAGGCTCCPYGGRMTACVTICVEAMEDIRRLLEALGPGSIRPAADAALLDIPPDRRAEGGDTVELKPCPFRVHGERTASCTIQGEYYYNETFMPCMKRECPCYHEDTGDAWCDRNSLYMKLNRRANDG